MYTKNNLLPKSSMINGHQLSKLNTFEVAARHLSFTMAAQELSLSPSAISHQMKRLEDELGFKLFERFHRKVKLTSEGERISKVIHSSFNLINSEILETRTNEISGSLVVYCRPSIAQCWLVPKVADFYNKYPFVELDILTGNEDINFNHYNINLAIYYDHKRLTNLHCEPLMNEYIVPVCSLDYSKKHKLLNSPSNLKNCTLLHDKQAWGYKTDLDEWKCWGTFYNIKNLELCRGMGFDRSDLSIIAAINHAGVAIGRENLIAKKIESGELIKPFPDFEMNSHNKYYIVTPSKDQNSRVKVFIKWLKEQI